MPMISQVGRKAWSTRALIAGLYAVLVIGGFTMVYPFLLLIAGSTKTAVDIKDVSWLPAFLLDDNALYQKHIEALFNEQLDVMRSVYDSDVSSFDKIAPPAAIREKFVQAWRDFIAGDLPEATYTIGYMQAPVSRTTPKWLRSFREQMFARYGPAIDDANLALQAEYTGWNAFYLLPEDAYSRRSRPLETPLGEAWREFRRTVPEGYRYYFSLDGFFKAQFLKTQYTRDIAEYNLQHATSYASYEAISLSPSWPADGTSLEQRDWENFVRHTLNLAWVGFDEHSGRRFEQYIAAKYGEAAYATRLQRVEREAFLAGWTDPDTGERYEAPVSGLRVHGVDEMFRDYLRQQWPSIEELNAALGVHFRAWAEVVPPQQEWHYAEFLSMKTALRGEFIARNFRTALDHLAFHGRGIRNTVIYCALAVLGALLVNPLAAYAMSRYKPPSTYKLLLFLLLTMAFPPMVTQIPVFLMMRDLNLLNTFAALLLPGLAHGYSIFLLKGFFDAQPRDLYESAEIDGAGEWTMFWQITMSLAKPILAVVALQAFTTAYSNFMFALLICQDEAMWTMMVWLYQLQMSSGPGVVYASLLIAAIPTLAIFIFCQNIILRGIVVPVEK